MLARRAHDNDTRPRILVDRLEHETKLVALRHRDDVERRPVENDIGPLARFVDLDAEAVERRKARIGEGHEGHGLHLSITLKRRMASGE
jgi:hypothetical protein